MRMKLLRIKDNSQQKKDVFSQVAKLTGKIADKTLEQLEREGVFVFPETVKDAEDTPEMNPIEQIWKELRITGFRNEVFATLEKVVDRLCDTICTLTSDTIKSITGRSWIINCFN